MSKINQNNLQKGLLYIVPFIIGSILPIITLPIFTRFISVEDYGIYALTIAFGIFVSGVANFGLSIGYERNFFHSSSDKDKAAALLFSTLLFVILSTIFLGILTFIFKDKVSKLIVGSEVHANLFVWAFIASAITSLKVYFLIFFKNSENVKSFVWYSIDENLLNVIFSLFFVVYLKLGVIGLIYGQLIAGTIIFLLLVYKFVRMLPVKFNLSVLLDSLELSLPLTSRIFFGIIGTQFDKYLINLLNSIGGVGIYNLGQKIANTVFTYMTAVQNVYSPQVYKRMFEMEPGEGSKSIGKFLTPFLYISIAGGLGVSLFSEELIFILTPVSYHSATNVVSILALLNGTYFFGKQPQLIYAKKTGITSILTISGIFLNVAINVPFIKYWGFIGAAYGTLLSGVILGAITFWVSQKYYHIQWENTKLIVIYFSFFLFTFLTILFRELSMDYLFRLFIKITFILIYIGIGIWIGCVNKYSITNIKYIFKPNSKLV